MKEMVAESVTSIETIPWIVRRGYSTRMILATSSDSCKNILGFIIYGKA
jgi:hypothetical protein